MTKYQALVLNCKYMIASILFDFLKSILKMIFNCLKLLVLFISYVDF